MLTLRAAAKVLAGIGKYEELAALLPALGFGRAPEALDRAMRKELGLPTSVRRASVATGRGEMRALLLDAPHAALPELLSEVARRGAARSPHLHLLVVAIGADPRRVALAAWENVAQGKPRVRSLLLDPAHVLDSDAETFAMMAGAAGEEPELAWLRWLEILGREGIGARFYRALEQHVHALADGAQGKATAEDRAEIALLHVSRLLFLSFLQAKGWLDGDREFLLHAFDRSMLQGGHFDRRVLRPLFYGTLNTPPARRAPLARAFGRIPFLNGGLFARSPIERRCGTLRFDDACWGAFFSELLGRYRFTSREERSDWSEAAIDPEMLGRAFESLMAEGERRASGSFYTPQSLVARVTQHGLQGALEPLLLPHAGPRNAARLARAALGEERLTDREGSAVRAAIAGITVLDPACGSGAFLVHALERLADVTRAAGDERSLHDIRRSLLTRSIFGVDRSATAVWLCQLRLWLSIVIERDDEDPARVPPLPNLDRNIRVGDSLAGWDFAPGERQLSSGLALRSLRERYARATGIRKATLARMLDREERTRTVSRVERELVRVRNERRELIALRRAPDLFGERVRPAPAVLAQARALRDRAAELRRELRRLHDGGALPLAFGAHFADVAARGGFALVLGNPPWVRLHRIPPQDRLRLRREFASYRGAAWLEGATVAGAAHGFGGQVDLAALFTERAVHLLRPAGALSLLLPVKLWQSLAGGGVRQLLMDRTQLLHLHDCAGEPAAFDAAVYPSVLVARRSEAGSDATRSLTCSVTRGGPPREWAVTAAELPLRPSPGAPWLLIPPEVRAAFDLLARDTIPLAQSGFGRPLLGAKCGCNEAYVVRVIGTERGLAIVRDAEGREAPVERSLLRPLIRGEHLRDWNRHGDEWIVWPHDAGGSALETLPPHAERWFMPWRRRLAARTDCRGSRRWWSVFRVDGAANDAPRIAWPDVSRHPTAVVLEAGDPAVPLNSCYVLRAPSIDDAHALAALLRSPLASAWLHCCAEPARGGYRRHLAWTLALLPLPHAWSRARALLSPFGRAGASGAEVDLGELTHAAALAYGVPPGEVAPLLAWAS